MPDLSFYQWANALKGYALALGIAFAVVMIVLWWRRSQQAQTIDRKVQALRAYTGYLLNVNEKADLRRRAEIGRQEEQDTHHDWLLSYLLSTCNEVLLLDPTPEWHKVLRRQLEPHREALAEGIPLKDAPLLSDATLRLVDEVVCAPMSRGCSPASIAQRAASP
ncbi:MAG TPA: hypothetical protein VFF87_07120 [Hyphomicrobium sp.]|nr:hypothetical protein [Hyphomicrobium sp.]